MILHVCSVIADAILLTYVYCLVALLRVGLGAPVELLYTVFFAILPFVLIHILSLEGFEGYSFSKLRNESDVAYSAVAGAFMGTFVSFVCYSAFTLYYSVDIQVIGRSVFLIVALMSAFVLAGWRVWYLRGLRRRGESETRVAILGSAASSETVTKELSLYSRSGHEVAGWIMYEGKPDEAQSSSCLGSIADLAAIITNHKIDEILIAEEDFLHSPSRLFALIDICQQSSVAVHVLPDYSDAMKGRLDIHEIAGVPLVDLKGAPAGGLYPVVKRCIDIMGASVGLLISSPILVCSALAVKLTSPGPAFYSQVRLGRRNREFRIYKLRTMFIDAEKTTGPVWAAKDDPRVTAVGRFLRAKRLDEIPQLWNILRGDMSLVGPRPERPFFVEEFSKELPLFRLRTMVRPGLTSLSHVMGRYDSAPAHRLLYDLIYIRNLSFTLDVRIIIDTVKVVLTGRGAQ